MDPDRPAIVDAHQHFWDLSLGKHPWLQDEPPRSDGRPFSRWSTWQSGLRFGNGKPKPYVYNAFRLPFLVRSLGPDVVELFGGGRTGAGPVATIQAKAPGGRYRSIASVPVNENGYFSKIVKLKKAYRYTFRLRLGGLTRIKRPTVVL